MVQYVLLGGQLLVVAIVYLFVWRVLRGARRDLLTRAGMGDARAQRAPQESTIMPAVDVAAARRRASLADPRLVVLESDVMRVGVPFVVGRGLAIGRDDANDIVLADGVVSGRHARIVPPATVVDDGSTNGTFINAARVRGRATLGDGDLLQVGSTVFRFESGGAR